MPWTCEQTEEHLLEAMDGTIDPLQRAEMDEHVAGCANCAGLLQSVRQTVGMLHSLKPAEPGPWLATQIVARTTPSPPKPQRRPAWVDFALHPRILLGALAVVITFSVVFGALGGSRSFSPANANPVRIYRQVDRMAHLAYARGVKFISDLRVVYEIQSRFRQPSADPPQILGKAPSLVPPEQNFDWQQESRYGLKRNLRSGRQA